MSVSDVKKYQHESVHSNEFTHFMPYDADILQTESDLKLEESHYEHKKAMKKYW